MKHVLKMSKNLKPRQFQLMDVANGHPNKIPFKCALFEVDKPSDGSPEGAGGKRIRVSSEVCDQYLQTFVGMAFNIDYHNEMRGHDTRFKVGVMEKVYRSMDGFAMVEGYLYGKDFPDVIATIRYYNGLAEEYGWEEFRFGASLEMEATVKNAEDDPDVLDVIEFVGTGGAILFAESAAFKNTSFAAKNSNQNQEVSEVDKKELQELLEGLKKDLSASVEKAIGEVKTEVGAIKTELDALKAADQKKKEEDQKAAADAELKAAQEKVAALEKELAELKAAAAKPPVQEPERKTATAAQLLAKYGKTVGEEVENDHRAFCAAVDQLNLDPVQAMTLKMKHKDLLAASQKQQ